MKKLFIVFIVILILIPIKTNNMSYDINKKTICITFDDGPSKYTNAIVDLFAEYGYSATFFVIGEKAEKNPDIVLNTYKKGNQIGNHTYSHIWLTHYKVEEVLKEIEKTDDIIESIIGRKSSVFRPSYGSINKTLRTKIEKDIVLWTNDSSDWKIKNHKTIASNIIRSVKDGDIILMHDSYERTYEALKIILPILKRLDFQVVTLETYYEIEKLRDYERSRS